MGDAIKVDCHVEIPLRDGVALRADVYRPDDTTPHPVLLARLPYSKDLSPISLSLLSPIRAARRGVVSRVARHPAGVNGRRCVGNARVFQARASRVSVRFFQGPVD